jgi:hypothetical protein
MSSSIFVFGSNLAGIHGAGAALHAHKNRGAQLGIGIGRTGDAYAIPTKDHHIETLPLERIRIFVKQFLDYAALHPELTFEVTRIGCGLAGYVDLQIAPMFEGATDNCQFAPEWRPFFGITSSTESNQREIQDLHQGK